jgi:hypothetical protein
MEDAMWWLLAMVPFATFAILFMAWRAPLTAIDFACSRLDTSLDAARDDASGRSGWARPFGRPPRYLV